VFVAHAPSIDDGGVHARELAKGSGSVCIYAIFFLKKERRKGKRASGGNRINKAAELGHMARRFKHRNGVWRQ